MHHNTIQQNINSYGPIQFNWNPKNIQKPYILRKLDPFELRLLQVY